MWYFDLEAKEAAVTWELVDDVTEIIRDLFESRRIARWSSGPFHTLYEPNPATGFAAELLWGDLQEWGWTQGATPKVG